MFRPALRVPGQVVVVLLALVLAAPGAATAAPTPVDDYAEYQPQTRCRPQVRAGTAYLGHWLVRRYGGGFGPTSRPCSDGGTSEHKDGRAFDWTLDATRRADRASANEFLERAFRTDPLGNHDAWARRMGIMYVIWNDEMYSAWDGFEPEPYLSSGCRSLRRCSATLRHRDHLHVSLSRSGGRGETSWYADRLPPA